MTLVACNLSPATYSLDSAYDAANQRTDTVLVAEIPNVGGHPCPHTDRPSGDAAHSVGVKIRWANACSYDLLGRLTAITNDFITAQYVCDEAGNMTGKTVSYEANRSLITSITDSKDGVRAFSYDPARQLTQAESQSFTYDAAGRLTGIGTTNATFPTTVTTYKDGNLIGSLAYPATSTVVSLEIACDTPANVQNWLVEANGVKPISSNYTGLATSFVVTNVPLGGTSAWARVKLEGEGAAAQVNGWSAWGEHQPATNLELH